MKSCDAEIIRSFETGWSLTLESQKIAFTEKLPGASEENDRDESRNYFGEKYPYELLLEKWRSEEQKAKADPNYKGIDNFRVTLSQQDEYYAYLQNTIEPQESDKVRVLLMEPGIQQNLQGQDVRKIEIMVEMELNLRASESYVVPQNGVLKGIARFKYREDLYQGEMVKYDKKTRLEFLFVSQS